MRTIDRDVVKEHSCLSSEAATPKKRLQSTNRKKDIQKIISSVIIVFSLGFMVWGGVVFFQANNNGYIINVDGQAVATVTSQQEADAAVDKYLAARAQERGYDVTYKEDITYTTVPAKQCQFITSDEAALLLADKLTEVVAASVLFVDGNPVMALPSEEEALKVIELAKKYYINDGDQVVDAKIREEITITPDLKDPDQIVKGNIARNLLLFGTTQDMTHTVVSADETLWTIANQYDIDVKALKKANPGLTSDDLQIGTSVKLAQASPRLTVVIVKEVEKTVKLAYSTKTIDNSDMLRGQQKIITPGVAGEEDVVLHVVESNGQQTGSTRVSSVITVAPVTQVVERGTKMVVASRGDGGYGRIGWPVAGRITSKFGSRSRGYHTGVDIDGSTGDRIVAAESGTVVFSGWGGGYGYIVKIDHGNGLQTWYAHLSKLAVDYGDKVDRGTYIGNMGSTGNSTGSHLHFEVRINGEAYNPLNYLP